MSCRLKCPAMSIHFFVFEFVRLMLLNGGSLLRLRLDEGNEITQQYINEEDCLGSWTVGASGELWGRRRKMMMGLREPVTQVLLAFLCKCQLGVL